MIQIYLPSFYRIKSKELDKDLLVTNLESKGSEVRFLKIGFYEYCESINYNLLKKEDQRSIRLFNTPVQAIRLTDIEEDMLRKQLQ